VAKRDEKPLSNSEMVEVIQNQTQLIILLRATLCGLAAYCKDNKLALPKHARTVIRSIGGGEYL
jgi:hypothetical protein